MSKGKASRSSSAPAARRKRRSSRRPSLVIPIAVGLVVVVLAAGVIASLAGGPADSAAGGASGSVLTAQPLPTQPLPYPNVPRVSIEEAQAKLEQGQAVLVDVRSKASYDEAHAAGAVSIPEEEIEARLGELPRDKDLILYCT